MAVIAAIGTVVFVHAAHICAWWTRKPEISDGVGDIARVLLIGTALNGVMHFPYAIHLAMGRADVAFRINRYLLCITLPSAWLLTLKFGPIGAAATWVITNSAYLFIGMDWTHRILPAMDVLRWFRRSVVFVPLASGGLTWIATMALRANFSLESPADFVCATLIALLIAAAISAPTMWSRA
jgi:O-antigen/teichoic acid export membrane protein